MTGVGVWTGLFLAAAAYAAILVAARSCAGPNTLTACPLVVQGAVTRPATVVVTMAVGESFRLDTVLLKVGQSLTVRDCGR